MPGIPAFSVTRALLHDSIEEWYESQDGQWKAHLASPVASLTGAIDCIGNLLAGIGNGVGVLGTRAWAHIQGEETPLPDRLWAMAKLNFQYSFDSFSTIFCGFGGLAHPPLLLNVMPANELVLAPEELLIIQHPFDLRHYGRRIESLEESVEVCHSMLNTEPGGRPLSHAEIAEYLVRQTSFYLNQVKHVSFEEAVDALQKARTYLPSGPVPDAVVSRMAQLVIETVLQHHNEHALRFALTARNIFPFSDRSLVVALGLSRSDWHRQRPRALLDAYELCAPLLSENALLSIPFALIEEVASADSNQRIDWVRDAYFDLLLRNPPVRQQLLAQSAHSLLRLMALPAGSLTTAGRYWQEALNLSIHATDSQLSVTVRDRGILLLLQKMEGLPNLEDRPFVALLGEMTDQLPKQSPSIALMRTALTRLIARRPASEQEHTLRIGYLTLRFYFRMEVHQQEAHQLLETLLAYLRRLKVPLPPHALLTLSERIVPLSDHPTQKYAMGYLLLLMISLTPNVSIEDVQRVCTHSYAAHHPHARHTLLAHMRTQQHLSSDDIARIFCAIRPDMGLGNPSRDPRAFQMAMDLLHARSASRQTDELTLRRAIQESAHAFGGEEPVMAYALTHASKLTAAQLHGALTIAWVASTQRQTSSADVGRTAQRRQQAAEIFLRVLNKEDLTVSIFQIAAHHVEMILDTDQETYRRIVTALEGQEMSGEMSRVHTTWTARFRRSAGLPRIEPLDYSFAKRLPQQAAHLQSLNRRVEQILVDL